MTALSSTRKLQLVRALERLTAMLALNRRYVSFLRNIIMDIAERSGRNARVLELAGGAGGLALALAEEVSHNRLPAEITSSDIVPAYVAEGKETAGEKDSLSPSAHLTPAALKVLSPAQSTLSLWLKASTISPVDSSHDDCALKRKRGNGICGH